MTLSPEREAELIEQNMPKIYRAVDNYMARCSKSTVIKLPYEDCVQEVSIVFLQYIRKCETEEALDTFPWYDAIHALAVYTLSSQTVKTPIRTSDFNKIIHSIQPTVSRDLLLLHGYDDIHPATKDWERERDTYMDFDSFMGEQSEAICRMVSMRYYGMTIQQIADQFGLSKSTVAQKMKDLKDKYDKFNEEDDTNE